jgi:hydrogenase-1 operon protein HyaE
MEPSPFASPDIPRLLNLFARLVQQHGFDAPGAGGLDAWTQAPGQSLLFFGGDPRRVPETWDVAVVLPDIVAGYRPGLRVALLDPALSQTLAGQYAVTVLPALVLLSDGRPIGSIERMRGWDEYAESLAAILGPSHPPRTH